MSVLIKGMKMPDNCAVCPIMNPDEGYCEVKQKRADNIWDRPNWCPVVEVLTPHGRLIDADQFFNSIAEKERLLSFDHSGLYVDISDMNDLFKHIETIVEAEDER